MCCLRETHGPPKLPEGYRLDFSADPDAPALRRPDGTVVARFAVRGMRHEALEAVMNSIRNGLGMRETEIVK